LRTIDAVIVTHSHADAIGGIHIPLKILILTTIFFF